MKELKKLERRRMIAEAISSLLILLCSFSAGLCVKQGDWVFFVPNVSLIIINLLYFKKLLD